jgi:hypothetical protein
LALTYNGGNHSPAIPLLRKPGGILATRPRQLELPYKKPHLAGTSHKPGWTPHARVLRAFLKALYKIAPPDRGDFERAAEEVIDHGDQLNPKARYLHRFVFAELVKISRR